MITTEWLEEIEKIDELVDIFLNNVGPEYITHIEIEEGRAVDLNVWSENLRYILKQELEHCIKNKNRIPIIKVDNVIKGYALLKINYKTIIIEDIVVSEKGLGSKLMDFIERAAFEEGMDRIIGDIGIKNERAKRFMDKLGFEKQTIVYSKKIK